MTTPTYFSFKTQDTYWRIWKEYNNNKFFAYNIWNEKIVGRTFKLFTQLYENNSLKLKKIKNSHNPTIKVLHKKSFILNKYH